MRATLAAVAAAVLLASCGIPQDDDPRTLPEGDVPFELLAPATTTTTTMPAPLARVQVFLVRGDRLVAVGRGVTGPATVARVVDALLTGPTAAESRLGLRSAISNETKLLGVDASGEVVTVDLSNEFTEVGGQEQLLALAQIVYTLTDLPSISGVRFRLAGQPVEVPRGDGTLTSGALTRSDYASLAPA